jgi:hypothetical protein
MVSLTKDKLSHLVLVLFFIYTAWWVILNLSGSRAAFPNYLFGAVYGTSIALFGSVMGLISAGQWGGTKSVMGKAVIFLSLGLFAEFFGQLVNSFYNLYLKVEVIYPSLGDLGFFGNIPLYIIGILLLARASGVKITVRSFASQIQAVLIPAVLLSASYLLFLRNYTFDWSKPLTVILDFGYPLGQALYVALALLTFNLTRTVLGGVMRLRVFLLLIAFVIQYAADLSFLFANSAGSYYVGGYVDFIYLLAYTVMTLGLLQLRATAKTISQS